MPSDVMENSTTFFLDFEVFDNSRGEKHSFSKSAQIMV